MAAKPGGDPPKPISETMSRFVKAHVENAAPREDKADVSWTVYVSKLEADHIGEIQTKCSKNRQQVLRLLIQAGLEQFSEATGWWKDPKGKVKP